MMDLNYIFINDIVNKYRHITDDEDINRFAFLRDRKTFSINLGRRSGKTESIVKFIKENPHIDFLIIPFSEGLRIDFIVKLEGHHNYIFAHENSHYNHRDFDIAFIDNYSYFLDCVPGRLDRIESYLYSTMGQSTKRPMYIRMG